MKIFWYIFAGIVSGILGGMGMGGGTILMPILSIFYKLNFHTVQAINLLSFIPMSLIAIIIHLKNKMINFNKIMLMIIPGILSSVVGFYLTYIIGTTISRRLFGGFLIILAIFQITELIIAKIKK